MTGIFLSVLVVCILLILFSRPRRRDGLAPEGGSRLKNALALAMVKSGRRRPADWQSAELADGRVPVPPGVDAEFYNDSFVFQGADARGNVFLTRLGFRPGIGQTEVWFWGAFDGRRLANDDRFVSAAEGEDSARIAEAGLEYSRIGEGEWRITYQGTLNGEPAGASLLWKADSALYCSADHMDPRCVARAMAEMPWDKEYFAKLRSENQVRIEQGGILTGTIEVGDSVITLDMKGIRDHSWGKRDWNYINRYMWTVLALEEPADVAGVTDAKYLVVSPADYGTSFRRLTSGWVAGDRDVKPVVLSTDLPLIGGDGVIPGEFTVEFRTPGSAKSVMRVVRNQPEMPWIMNEGRFEVNEAWCEVTVDGATARGVSEFGYAAGLNYDRPFESKE